MGLGDDTLEAPGSVSDLLRCVICQEFFLDPVEVTAAATLAYAEWISASSSWSAEGVESETSTVCDHVFCRACIEPVVRSKPSCPMCRTVMQPGSLKPFFFGRQIVDEIKIRFLKKIQKKSKNPLKAFKRV